MNENTAFIEFNYEKSIYRDDTHTMNDTLGSDTLVSVSMLWQIIHLFIHLFKAKKKVRIKIIILGEYEDVNPVYLKCIKDANGILLPGNLKILESDQKQMMHGRYGLELSNSEIKSRYNFTDNEFRRRYDKIIDNYIGNASNSKQKNCTMMHNFWLRDYPDYKE
jgi:hypothetical protein